MNPADIFDTMVRYHIDRNLAACLPYHDGEGVICPPANMGLPVEEGKENFQYRGQLIFQNGNTLLHHLLADGHVKNRLDIFDGADAYGVASPEEIYAFLGRNHGDGVHVYETALDHMVRVAKIEAPDPAFSQRLPPHFVHFQREGTADLEKELRRTVGTKTRLALALTGQYENVRALQIKQSGYTPLGMGQVVEINHDGLRRAFFFKYIPREADPDRSLPYLAPDHRIAGVMKHYKPQDGRIVLERERFVQPEEYFRDGSQSLGREKRERGDGKEPLAEQRAA